LSRFHLASFSTFSVVVASSTSLCLSSSAERFSNGFEREARAVSRLNHPHICTLHDLGSQDDGVDYVVMEYQEGETLAHRLKNGPLPSDHVSEYAIQITDALDTAHRHGVIHRDVKPGNIILTKKGAKRQDFGLAKMWGGAVPNRTALPTETTPLTDEGMILGTLQYMAPEQLEGKEADVAGGSKTGSPNPVAAHWKTASSLFASGV
jgi:serine/threonine protein kinase